MKNFRLLLIAAISIMAICVCSSCSKDDDEKEESGLKAITTSELESTPSFYKNGNYVWFRNGTMVWWEDMKYVHSYSYTISGQNLTIKNQYYTYKGYISKVVGGSKTQLAISQGLDGTNLGNLPKGMLNWYDYSTYNPKY